MEGEKLRSRARGIDVVRRQVQSAWLPLVIRSKMVLIKPSPSSYLGPSRQAPPDTRAAASPPRCDGERLTCELQTPCFAMQRNRGKNSRRQLRTRWCRNTQASLTEADQPQHSAPVGDVDVDQEEIVKFSRHNPALPIVLRLPDGLCH